MARSTLTSKGQITIPKAIRERLGLQVGETLEFRIVESGRVELTRAKVESSAGIVGLLGHLAPEEPVSVEAMDEAIAEAVRARVKKVGAR